KNCSCVQSKFSNDTTTLRRSDVWSSEIFLCFSQKNSRKIVRVYSPNLVMIQQRYEDPMYGHPKYFYALAKKTQISKDKTIIAMTSANI
ncbi:hypothetical protein PCHDK_000546400, partial [Plasmodium chabaudi adami]